MQNGWTVESRRKNSSAAPNARVTTTDSSCCARLGVRAGEERLVLLGVGCLEKLAERRLEPVEHADAPRPCACRARSRRAAGRTGRRSPGSTRRSAASARASGRATDGSSRSRRRPRGGPGFDGLRGELRHLRLQVGRDAARLLPVAPGDIDEACLVGVGAGAVQLRRRPSRSARRSRPGRRARGRVARPWRGGRPASRRRRAASSPAGPTRGPGRQCGDR